MLKCVLTTHDDKITHSRFMINFIITEVSKYYCNMLFLYKVARYCNNFSNSHDPGKKCSYNTCYYLKFKIIYKYQSNGLIYLHNG